MILTLVFFLTANLVAWFIIKVDVEKNYSLKNKHNKNSDNITLPFPTKKISESIRYNTFENNLTIASGKYIFRVKPNPSQSPLNGYEGINQLGFRSQEIDFEKDKSKIRVLILGDSCAFGWRILKSKNTWPTLLEVKLREKDINSLIINRSQPGYSTTQTKIMFQEWFHKIKPDVVIFYVGWNDIWGSEYFTDSQLLSILSHQSDTIFKLLTQTPLYKALERHKWKTTKRSSDVNAIRVPLKESIKNFEFMLKEIESNKSLAIIIPLEYARGAEHLKSIDLINQKLKTEFENRIILPQIRELSHNYQESDQFYFEDQLHPNINGSVLIANSLAEIITAKVKK